MTGRLPRDLALEDAILAAPLDPVPRQVYGDWLQSQAAIQGDWIALSAAAEAAPDDLRLRAAAIAFLDQHRRDLLGDGAALLPGLWIGWRTGFADELRIQSFGNAPARAVAKLIAHPTCRFVRHLGLGMFPHAGAVLDSVLDDPPPLLETLIAFDEDNRHVPIPIAGLAALPQLRRLALRSTAVAETLPGVVELSAQVDVHGGWLAAGGCPDVVELTLDCYAARQLSTAVADIARALPGLRRLRLLNMTGADDALLALVPHARALELLDVSHGDATRLGLAAVAELPALRELIALRVAASLRAAEVPAAVRIIASEPAGPATYRVDDDGDGDLPSWWSHRLETEGRDAFRLIPGAGSVLYRLGARHMASRSPERMRRALAMFDASVTYPESGISALHLEFRAIAYERAGDLHRAELAAREGMLHAPLEPNFFAIAIDALRRTDRLEEALALLPQARRALDYAGASTQRSGPACLVDMMLACAQAGRHEEVVELIGTFDKLAEGDAHAVVAMSLVALGHHAAARDELRRSRKAHIPGLVDHASAVLALARPRPGVSVALAKLRDAHQAGYPEWHWIVRGDPNLAAVAREPQFRALVAEPLLQSPRATSAYTRR